MAAEYTPVSREQMSELLTPQGFKPLDLPGTRELVYGKRVDVDGLVLSCRVYTGIEPGGYSREVGTDAIRADLWWRRPDGEVRRVASSKRVHRTQGWAKNLQSRLDSLTVGRRCTECGAPMVTRKGRNGPFLGCAGYPECRQTAPVAA